MLDGALEVVEAALAFGHFVPHVALETTLQKIVGERAEEILKAHFAGGVGNVFGIADTLHKQWPVIRSVASKIEEECLLSDY